MKNKFFQIAIIAVLFFVAASFLNEVAAQCPMCKASAQSNMQNGGSAGRGLNTGILYMLAVPYLLVASIGYWWWRNRKAESQQATELTEDDL